MYNSRTHKRGNSGVTKGVGAKSRKVVVDNKPMYRPTNDQLHSMATYHEIDPNNNNIFAGKNLSDNSKITSFYTLKS